MVSSEFVVFGLLAVSATVFATPVLDGRPSTSRSSILTRDLASQSGGIGPIADLTIANKAISPDGFKRSSVLANGVFPGPLIVGNKGSNFLITVEDQLTDDTMVESTTIHWHGLFQETTNWADGAAFVTQCPIVPGDYFLYDFYISQQAGTFWYHSHIAAQYCDGLRGPLVVYDPNDPHANLYDVDDAATVITLADWYHIVSPAEGPIPVPDSTLINGLGRYEGGPLSTLAVISVTQGTRYRFRLVSTSCDPSWEFSIDGHSMTIIEADGINTVPYVVDSLNIYAAQRYSFVLNANQEVGNYWIRANPSAGPDGFDNGLNSAILRYKGASNADPTTLQSPSVLPLNETQLQPLQNPAAPGKPYPGGADVNLNLQLGLTPDGLNFTINNVSFVPPSVPVLLQIMSGVESAHKLLPYGSVYSLPPNKVIEISLPGLSAGGGSHPFHLHGHSISVVRSAGSTEYNYVNPVRRDTVNTGLDGDNVTFRFETNNPGPWFLHCHIDWHLQAGFAIVLAEDIVDVPDVIDITPDWLDLCPIYTGGDL